MIEYLGLQGLPFLFPKRPKRMKNPRRFKAHPPAKRVAGGVLCLRMVSKSSKAMKSTEAMSKPRVPAGFSVESVLGKAPVPPLKALKAPKKTTTLGFFFGESC